jgi:hypothetical protein
MRRFYLIALIGMVGLSSCVNLMESEPEKKNNPPNTTLANVPVQNDTLYALVPVTWDGEDDDGYVIAYEYRYTTYPVGLAGDDSIVHEWTRTDQNALTIAFASPQELNRQLFQVRAIDNSGNVDPTPAQKSLYTLRTTPPITKILSPRTETEYFATQETNVWWPGVVVTVTSEDADGYVMEYGWSADEGELHWVNAKDSIIIVKPQDFRKPLTGDHSIKVVCKDDTYLIDPIGASIKISLVEPTFSKEILILDDTREDISLKNVADATVDAFYRDIFSSSNALTIDERDMKTRAFPSLRILGDYKLVIWHSDDSKTPFYLTNNKAMTSIENYLHAGGDLIICGTGIWDPWLPPADPFLGLPHPIPFAEGSFVRDYLHVVAGERSSIEGSFSGTTGVGGYIDLEIDSTKMNPAYPQYSKPHLVQVVVEKGAFTREIALFKGDDPYARDLPCAIRYYGDVFDISFIGFPLWAIKQDQARIFASQILKSMGY